MYLKLGLGQWISFPYELYALANEKWNLHSKKFVYLKLGLGRDFCFLMNYMRLHLIHNKKKGRAVNCHFFSAEAKNLNFWSKSLWIICGEGTRDAPHPRACSMVKNRTFTTKGGEEKKFVFQKLVRKEKKSPAKS